MTQRGKGGAATEGGFTILEVVVAIGVLYVALVAMAHAATVALLDIGHARQRQSATGLANQALEQVRALPAATVQLGLSAPELAADMAVNPPRDPNLSKRTVGGVTRYLYKGEELITYTPAAGATSPPLVPHRRQITIGPTKYWVGVYASLTDDGQTVRVTADVSWVDQTLRKGTSGKVESQTLVSPGLGCREADDVNPYSAPCAGDFLSEAYVDAASILIQPTQCVDPLDLTCPAQDTTSFEQASLDLPVASSKLQAGQVSVLDGNATTSRVSMKRRDLDAVRAGNTPIAAFTSNDPSAALAPCRWNATGPQGSDTLGAAYLANQVRTTTSAGDTASATSTVVARGAVAQPCQDLTAADPTTFVNKACLGPSDVDQTDHLPCGNVDAVQAGQLGGDLALPDGTTLPLARLAAPATTRARVDRDVNPSGTTCALEGCASATVSRSIGPVRLGGTPGGSAWALELDDVSQSATASAGEGAEPAAGAIRGTVKYWDPANGPQTLDLAALGTAPVSFQTSRSFSSGTYSIFVSGSFTARGVELLDPATGTAGCIAGARCRRASATAISGSPLRGSMTVEVRETASGEVVANLTIDIDIGRAYAGSSFTRAPGAV